MLIKYSMTIKKAHMRLYKFQMTLLLVLTLFLSYTAPSSAAITNLIQKLIYKEVYVMDPNGRETAALVNRFTDEVEYSWAVDRWIPAPLHLKQCYKNQRNIRNWVEKKK